jgi:acyl-CoA thioester hydrolase
MNRVPRPEGSGFVLGQVAVRYMGEVRVTDSLRVGSRITRIGKSSFDMGQALLATPDGGAESCVATCTSTLVHISMDGRRAAPLPDSVRQVLNNFL